jgi:hypothetical protein
MPPDSSSSLSSWQHEQKKVRAIVTMPLARASKRDRRDTLAHTSLTVTGTPTSQSTLAQERTSSMGFFRRLLGKNRPVDAQTAANRARSTSLAGREVRQTQAEQDATRGRMEAELDAQRAGRARDDAAAAAPCPHTALTPRWDSVAEMGNLEQVSSYTCQACNQSFTGAEGRTLLASEADRLRQKLGTEADGTAGRELLE